MTRILAGIRNLQAIDGDQADDEYESLFDPITHLAKPALLRDRLERALARATRRRRLVGVLFVRVHVPPNLVELGVLPLVAGRLRSAVRPDDTVARVGDYDFVVVCNDLVEKNDLEIIAERLRTVIRVRVLLDETKPVLAADIEATLAHPGDDARDLLERTRETAADQRGG